MNTLAFLDEELTALRALAKRIAEIEPAPYGSEECYFCLSWTGKHADDCMYESAVEIVQRFHIK